MASVWWGDRKILWPFTPRVTSFGVIRWKTDVFLEKKNLLLYSGALFTQTGVVYSYNVYHDPRSRASCANAWPYKSYSEMLYLRIFFSTHRHRSDKLGIKYYELCGHRGLSSYDVSHYCEHASISTLVIYSIVLRD